MYEKLVWNNIYRGWSKRRFRLREVGWNNKNKGEEIWFE